MKFGVQITETSPNDNAYCVYQLIQESQNQNYTENGAVLWIDKSASHSDKRLLEAIKLGLQGKITSTKSI